MCTVSFQSGTIFVDPLAPDISTELGIQGYRKVCEKHQSNIKFLNCIKNFINIVDSFPI